MRIVVVGAGGREHALAWRLHREGHEIVAIPGNPGISEIARCVAAGAESVEALAQACRAQQPDLVVVGPEAPLVAGLADLLRDDGVAVFGPSARAARLESSKAFSKDLMQRAGVPTARFRTVQTERGLLDALDELGGAVAVKADGLAAGKGVVVCAAKDEALAAGRLLLARGQVVVEERLSGPELSVIAITDGRGLSVLPPARDHKRLRDGDEGPNTGGMGAIAPVPVDAALLDEVERTILRPVLAAMEAKASPFRGALYAGLMLTPEGPKALEFNARFGDPETQALVVALSSKVSLAQLLLQSATRGVPDARLESEGAACAVVLAAAGYPEAPRAGDPITGLDDAKALGTQVFHAGTRMVDGTLVTSGGRVLSVVGQGATLAEARQHANQAAERVRFAGQQHRADIGASTG